MTRGLLILMLLALPIAAAGQSPAETEAQRLFEAGQYQQVVAAAGDDASPVVVYLAARSQQRLGAAPLAAALYDRLGARPDTDPWHHIGVSGRALVDGQLDPALAAADRAVALDGMLADAHYQRGLVLAARQTWAQAATAFDRVTTLQPRTAYAYYYAGLMYSRVRQTAQMAVRFEQFLRLAPDAPERPEVLQIMRTIQR